ncbi:MAG: MurR/RpiR family transcriptional regulator [Proteobacteria bacterium]|nr:MurR/RpiR family transcriptional regulator [Pseudomonadota bacterium]
MNAAADVSARIASLSSQLTQAEQRLADAVVAQPARISALSASDMAQEAGVHPATVVRLAQKLGYKGYLDLRSALRAETAHSDAARRVTDRLAHAAPDLLSSLVASDIDTLVELGRHVGQAQIDRAAKALLSATSITIAAQGNSTALAELLDKRLRRSGFKTRLAVGEGRDFAEHLIGLRSGDALLALSFRRPSRAIAVALSHAREVGAASLLIADAVARRYAPAPDMVLAAPRGLNDDFLTLTVPMAICNALVLTIARLDDGASVRALDALERLAGKLNE